MEVTFYKCEVNLAWMFWNRNTDTENNFKYPKLETKITE